METNFEAMERARAELAHENLGVAFRTLVRDAEALVRATAGDLNERTREARVQLAAALERSKVLGHQLKDQAVAGAHLADEAIHKQPYPWSESRSGWVSSLASWSGGAGIEWAVHA
jgi:ElaB/YqjD/DUF883 family membrane-anchored ribosome-binding protein